MRDTRKEKAPKEKIGLYRLGLHSPDLPKVASREAGERSTLTRSIKIMGTHNLTKPFPVI